MATCPKCGQPVTSGDGLTDSTEVRCPICETDSRPKENDQTDHPADETSDSDEEPGEPVAEEADVRARCPCCNAEFGLDEVLLRATGEPLGREAVAAITAEGRVKELPDPAGDIPDFAGLSTRDDASRIDIDLGNATGPAVADGAFDFVADRDDDADSASARTAVFGRRRPKEKSMMREFTGIVLGGVAGLAIAYYVLNFFGGPRFDVLEIYLPGIEHTSGHRPSWLPAGTATDVNPEDAGFVGSELED